MKKLTATALILFAIIMAQIENREGFYWATSILHICIAWWIAQHIKNNSLRAMAFLAIMSMMLITTNAMDAAAQTIPTKLGEVFTQISVVYQKTAETYGEVFQRASSKDWEKFNKSQALRRIVFLVTILIPVFTLVNESKRLVANLKNK